MNDRKRMELDHYGLLHSGKPLPECWVCVEEYLAVNLPPEIDVEQFTTPFN